MVYHLGCEFSPPYALMNEGTPNVRQRSSNIRATPCASFDRIGYANRNIDASSTTRNKYSLPAHDVFGNICKSTSSTSHDSRNLAGRMAMHWLRERFLRLNPHDNTSSRVSYTFLASGICLAAATTPEPPLGGHVGSAPKRAGLALGIMRPRVLTFSLPIPLRVRILATVSSDRLPNTYSARHLSTPLAPSCTPYYPALA